MSGNLFLKIHYRTRNTPSFATVGSLDDLEPVEGHPDLVFIPSKKGPNLIVQKAHITHIEIEPAHAD